MKNVFNSLVLCFCFSATIYAQGISLERKIESSSGNFVSHSLIQLSFTVGQSSAVSTLTNANIILTQGFQQPEGKGVGINELNIPFSSVSVFPNPATEQLTVRIDYAYEYNLTLQLHNLLGQQVRSLSASDQRGNQLATLNVTGIAQGCYLLEISVSDKGKTFRIIKKINIIN